MTSFQLDPNQNKVTNAYGGYDPNEKGITQYPKYISGTVNPSDCSFQHPFPPRDETSTRRKIFSSGILDPVTRHYRKFIQDPSLFQPLDHDEGKGGLSYLKSPELSNHGKDEQKPSSCCTSSTKPFYDSIPKLRKPIDPVHWKSDLFDTSYEKYYLRNLINEEPYREFLSSYAEATHPPHYFTEYRERYTGNPTMEAASLTIHGLSRPTDMTEPCYWKRYQTQKLRDVIFTHDKVPTDSHLDYNDPKRYNPWGRHLAGHHLLIQPNYRPRPWSGIEYSQTTLLPAISTRSRNWII